MENNPNLISIGKKSFISVVIILFSLMIIAGILTRVIAPGSYIRDDSGAIIDGSFSYITETINYPVWRWFVAPFTVLGSSDGLNIIVISLFLLILGGTFTIMDKTGGIKVMINKLITKYKHNKYTLLRLIILVFMVFGAFFGIFEESVALLPIMILLSLSLGWDTMIGIGMCLLAAGFGFASAITNPFSVGIASTIAGISILSGVWLRIIVFLIMYLVLSTFLVRYAKKLDEDPSISLSYEQDQKRTKSFNLLDTTQIKNEDLIFKSFLITFASVLLIIFLTSALELVGLSIPSVPVMALAFLVGGITSGYLITQSFKKTMKMFLTGVLSVAPAIVLILMATSVKHIITEGMVMDSILFFLSGILQNQSPIVALLFLYGLVLFIQFFIGSASAKAYLIMPLIIPLVGLIGISKELAILAFVFGDGYTNVIFPTNAVLLIGLSIASVSYIKWLRFTWKLQLFTLLLNISLLIIAFYIGY